MLLAVAPCLASRALAAPSGSVQYCVYGSSGLPICCGGAVSYGPTIFDNSYTQADLSAWLSFKSTCNASAVVAPPDHVGHLASAVVDTFLSVSNLGPSGNDGLQFAFDATLRRWHSRWTTLTPTVSGPDSSAATFTALAASTTAGVLRVAYGAAGHLTLDGRMFPNGDFAVTVQPYLAGNPVGSPLPLSGTHVGDMAVASWPRGAVIDLLRQSPFIGLGWSAPVRIFLAGAADSTQCDSLVVTAPGLTGPALTAVRLQLRNMQPFGFSAVDEGYQPSSSAVPMTQPSLLVILAASCALLGLWFVRKRSIAGRLLVVVAVAMLVVPAVAQATMISTSPTQTPLGTHGPGSAGYTVSFTVTAYGLSGSASFTAVNGGGLGAVYNISPASFTLSSSSPSQFVTAGVDFPTALGYWQNYIYIEQTDDSSVNTSHIFYGTVMGSTGINDYVLLSGPFTISPVTGGPASAPITTGNFHEVAFRGDFIDYDGNGTTASSWTWSIDLYHDTGTYPLTVGYVTSSTGSPVERIIAAPFTLPTGYKWTRDASGNVVAKVSTTCLDDEGFGHSSEMLIAVAVPPGKPKLVPTFDSVNGLALSWSADGATGYFVDYGPSASGPFNGTGLPAGNSPISMGTSTGTYLANAGDLARPLFVTVRATNGAGESERANPVVFSSCVSTPQGIVGLWPLDETSGAIALPRVGSANGHYLAGDGHVPGKILGCARLLGSSQYVQIDNNASLNFAAGQSFSLGAWIRLSGGSPTAYRGIVDKRALGVGYELFVSDVQSIGLQLANGVGAATNYYAPPGSLMDGDWHFVAAAVNRAGGATGGHFYIDGAAVGDFDPTGRAGSLVNGDDVYVGRLFNGSSDGFNGEIDDVQIYSRALSLADVYRIYTANRSGFCPYGEPPLPSDPQPLLKRPGATALEPPQTTPAAFELRAEPSLTHSGALFQFGRATSVPSRLVVFDVAGRTVRTLEVPVGERGMYWDGRDLNGAVVGSGLYLARLLGQSRGKTAQLVIVH